MSLQLIVSNPSIMMGKPVIAGTRITVEFILDELAAGATIESLLKNYPHLTRDSILAAIGFASDVLRSDIVYPRSQSQEANTPQGILP